MRSLSLQRRRRITKQIPPRRCGAVSARTGKPCREWAMVGGAVCVTHGGRSRQAKNSAAVVVSLAEALVSDDQPRAPFQVLLFHLHTLDVVARQVRDQVMASPSA